MSPPAAGIEIDIRCKQWALRCPDAERLVRAAAGLALAEGAEAAGIAFETPVELSIALLDDAEQRRLNHHWRGVDRATNVLAFPAWEPGGPAPSDAPLLLGDVTLAAETVAREAGDQGKSTLDHLSHLVVHGILHLIGYDHLTERDAAAMESLEIRILAELGVADPYRGTM